VRRIHLRARIKLFVASRKLLLSPNGHTLSFVFCPIFPLMVCGLKAITIPIFLNSSLNLLNTVCGVKLNLAPSIYFLHELNICPNLLLSSALCLLCHKITTSCLRCVVLLHLVCGRTLAHPVYRAESDFGTPYGPLYVAHWARGPQSHSCATMTPSVVQFCIRNDLSRNLPPQQCRVVHSAFLF